MGLLKHVILPVFAVLHFVGSFLYFAKDRINDIVGGSWPGLDGERTVVELHLLGSVGAGQITMFAGCLAGIFVENSHFRGVFTMMATLYFALDCYDAYVTGFPWKVMAAMTVLGTVGSAVHASEPGIFTKDKAKVKSS